MTNSEYIMTLPKDEAWPYINRVRRRWAHMTQGGANREYRKWLAEEHKED